MWPWVLVTWSLPLQYGNLRLFDLVLASYCLVASLSVARGRSLSMPRVGTRYAPYYLFALLNALSLVVVGVDHVYGRRPDMASLFASLVVFGLMTITLVDAHQYEHAMSVVIYATAVVVLILIAEHALLFKSLYLTSSFTENRYVNGGYNLKNQLGFYLSLVFPFVYARMVRATNVLNAVIFLILTVGIFYTFSRMAVLNYVVAGIAFCFVPSLARRRYQIAGALVAGSFVVLAAASGLTPSRYLDIRRAGQIAASTDAQIEVLRESPEEWIDLNLDRARYIVNALGGLVERPLFGHGITSFSQDHAEYRDDGTVLRMPVTHNDYAQVGYELGGVGLAVLLSLFIVAIWKILPTVELSEPLATLRDGQLVSLLVLGFSLNMINAYETVPLELVESPPQFSLT